MSRLALLLLSIFGGVLLVTPDITGVEDCQSFFQKEGCNEEEMLTYRMQRLVCGSVTSGSRTAFMRMGMCAYKKGLNLMEYHKTCVKLLNTSVPMLKSYEYLCGDKLNLKWVTCLSETMIAEAHRPESEIVDIFKGCQ